MNRTEKPHMNDPADTDIHDARGVAPYPAAKSAEKAGRPQDDEKTSRPDNSFERGGEHEDGEYIDAVDAMKKTLKDNGALEDWRKGRTQGSPRKA